MHVSLKHQPITRFVDDAITSGAGCVARSSKKITLIGGMYLVAQASSLSKVGASANFSGLLCCNSC